MFTEQKLLVAQLGARGHYAIPRILHQEKMLEHFYTDICAVKGFPKYLRLIPPQLQSKSLARLTGRVPKDIPTKLITTFSGFGFEYVQRLRQAFSRTEVTKTFLWAGKTFNQLVLKQGLRGTGIYTFNTAGLELLQAAKKKGLKGIMEQTIAPHRIEYSLLQQEQELHPGWSEPMQKDEYCQEYIDREQQEWSQADIILCGSEFVRDSIGKCGGPVKRCVVVPYGVDTKFQVAPKQTHNSPLRVLTIGSVGLRKGTPYVLEAAKRLKGKAIFRMVGPINVSAQATSILQENLELVGQVPRSQIHQHYAWADVFLLPSICEGSATVTYEALACGLPVITTPNTGSIVRDNIDGYIVPIRDVEAIVSKLELLISQPELLQQMNAQALKISELGSLTSYQTRLLQVLN
ncbi:MAG: glycosyltransferase family 4 protein [Xenococcaceae cyanobacterium MO_188.B29]|nr:glycosyltransferase family 4 protein [Xenococcaceae cyanobacterium MO_188.B29]